MAKGCSGGTAWGSLLPQREPEIVTPGIFWKFAFNILSSGAISAKKLASVGVYKYSVYSETRKTGAA